MSSPAQWTLRQRFAIGSMVAGPILATVGSALQPKDSNHALTEYTRFAAHRDEYYLGFLLLAIGGWLLAPAAVALLNLFRDKGSRVGVVACMAIAVGSVAVGAGSLLQGTATWLVTSHRVSRASGVSVINAAQHSALAGLPWIVGAVAFLGMLVVGITLLHAKTAPWWQAVLMILTPVGIILGPSGPISVLFSIPLLAAFISLAYTVYRMPAAAPAAIDLTEAVPSQAAPVSGNVKAGTTKAKAKA